MAVLEVPPVDDQSSRPTEWLADELMTQAAHIAAATCRFLLLLAEFDRRKGYERWESHSCAHWLGWKVGMSLRTAQDHVRVARALEQLPVTTKAFAAGQLSYSKVRAITRVATPKSEGPLVEVAMHGTAAHLDRIVAGFCTVKRNLDPDRSKAQLRRRGVWLSTADDGTATLTVRGPADAVATIMRAADAAAKELPEQVDEPDFKGAAQRFDGLEQIALTFTEPDRTMAPRPEVVIHADLTVLTEREPGRAEIEAGPRLTATTLERLACDCSVRLTTEADGKTLDVGRRSRQIPIALARAILDRDRSRCRFPGCTQQGRLQIHHRQHWSRGGGTDQHNCFLACRYHHKVLHEGGWHAEGDATGALTFVDPLGRRMPEVLLPPPKTDPNAVRRDNIEREITITADTIQPRWYSGDRLDLHHAVDSLWQLDPPFDN
jgi:hypothetical protein